jgi:uncharacterized membrane protein YhaH (DUF805 family)
MGIFSNVTQSVLPKGRIRRRHYLIRTCLCILLMVFIGNQTESNLFNVFILGGIFYFISQTIKRLHDLNMKGWWTILMVVPILNILFGLFVSFKKGTSGYNQYGSDPKVKNQFQWS